MYWLDILISNYIPHIPNNIFTWKCNKAFFRHHPPPLLQKTPPPLKCIAQQGAYAAGFFYMFDYEIIEITEEHTVTINTNVNNSAV